MKFAAEVDRMMSVPSNQKVCQKRVVRLRRRMVFRKRQRAMQMPQFPILLWQDMQALVRCIMPCHKFLNKAKLSCRPTNFGNANLAFHLIYTTLLLYHTN